MAKKDKKMSAALQNLDGFMTKGAKAKSKLNIPTGHFIFDFALHYGFLPTNVDFSELEGYDPKVPLGLPCGRLIELYGTEGSGKSSLAYRTCGMAREMGYEAAWIDTEHSFEEDLATLNGLKVDELLYSEAFDQEDPDTIFYAEDIMDKIVALCINAEALNLKVIVLDSVASLIPRDVGMSSANDDTMALLARILSKTLPKVAQHAAIHDVLVIFINQIREKPGVSFGNPQTTPGGKALKYNASVRLNMTKRTSKEQLVFSEEEDKETGEVKKVIVGRNSGLSVEKNRCGPPLLDDNGNNIVIDLPVYYRRYFPEIEEVAFNIARQIKLVSVRTGTYTWKSTDPSVGDIKVEGRTAFMDHVVENGLLIKFIDEVRERAGEQGTLIPPELTQVSDKELQKKMDAAAKEAAAAEEAGDSGKTASNDVLDDMFDDPDEGTDNGIKKKTKRGRKKKSS